MDGMKPHITKYVTGYWAVYPDGRSQRSGRFVLANNFENACRKARLMFAGFGFPPNSEWMINEIIFSGGET